MRQIPQTAVAPAEREPSTALIDAVQQFNAGKYFACHETLEELWLAEKGGLRRFYQGLLQVGVGLYHLQRGNERGALILLARGRGMLASFSPAYLGLDVEALVRDAEMVETFLRENGLQAAQMASSQLFPKIRMVVSGQRPEDMCGSG